MNIMAPGMGITRMRRLLGNPCNPVYLGYLIGYCSSCQKNLVPKGERVWDLAKFMVVLVDGYHNVVQTWRAFFLLFNVTIVGTGCMLEYLDVLKRYIEWVWYYLAKNLPLGTARYGFVLA